MKKYTFKQILKASQQDRSAGQADSATPAEVYISRHLNGGLKKGDKAEAIKYLKNKKVF